MMNGSRFSSTATTSPLGLHFAQRRRPPAVSADGPCPATGLSWESHMTSSTSSMPVESTSRSSTRLPGRRARRRTRLPAAAPRAAPACSLSRRAWPWVPARGPGARSRAVSRGDDAGAVGPHADGDFQRRPGNEPLTHDGRTVVQRRDRLRAARLGGHPPGTGDRGGERSAGRGPGVRQGRVEEVLCTFPLPRWAPGRPRTWGIRCSWRGPPRRTRRRWTGSGCPG